MKTLMKPLMVFALLGSAMLAEEPGNARRVELRDVPLADAIREVEAATGRKFEVPAGVAEGRKVTFVARGTPDEIVGAFGVTLEKTQELTLLPGQNGALRLHRFIPARPVAPRLAPRGRRLSVEVVEGSVALIGDRGRVTVKAGEKSFVASGSLPTEPIPFDASTVASWRFKDAAPSSAGLAAQIVLPDVKCRLVGYTDSGSPILEVEIAGSKQQLVFGEVETDGIGRSKFVVEGNEVVLPLNIRLKLDKGSK